MAENKKPTAPKITDITGPGKSAPPATSKPVIVTNRPLIKDPMVTDQPAETSADEPAPTEEIKIPVRRQALVLEPDSGATAAPKTAQISPKSEKTEKTETEPDPESESKPATAPLSAETKQATPADASAKDKAAEPAAERAMPATSDSYEPAPAAKLPADAGDGRAKDSAPAEETPAAEAPADPAQSKTPAEETDAETKKQAEHDAAIQKLVDGKEYFLSINAVEKRRTKHFVILGVVLSVMLALAWVDIALDAGLIHLGAIKPITHFFST